jgi:hypothetical protein
MFNITVRYQSVEVEGRSGPPAGRSLPIGRIVARPLTIGSLRAAVWIDECTRIEQWIPRVAEAVGSPATPASSEPALNLIESSRHWNRLVERPSGIMSQSIRATDSKEIEAYQRLSAFS